MNVYQGMIILKWCNNEGIVHRFRIPNSYYVPAGKCKCCLPSPQHWDKSKRGNYTASKVIGYTMKAHTTTIV